MLDSPEFNTEEEKENKGEGEEQKKKEEVSGETSLESASSSGVEFEENNKSEDSICLSEGDPDRVSSIAAQSMKSYSLWGGSMQGAQINPSFNFRMLNRSIAMQPVIDKHSDE